MALPFFSGKFFNGGFFAAPVEAVQPGGGWASPRYRQRTENDEAFLLIALL